MGRPIHRFSVWLLSLTFATVAETGAAAQQQRSPSWSLTFRYGGGTPNDAGPLGHCTATFTSDGKVRIESKKRRTLPPLVVYETQSLGRRQLEAISKAADAALKERPFSRRGANEDGMFLRLEREGDRAARVDHSQMNDFSDAPPAMQAFVGLVNQLLPEEERIPLKKRPRARSTTGGQ